jgi:hypothetical protein
MILVSEHPEIEELVGWARGALSRRRRSEIRLHCETCLECNELLAKILVLRTPHRRKMRVRTRRRRLLVAASLVLIGAIGTSLWLGGFFISESERLAALATEETIQEAILHLRFREALPADSTLYLFKLKRGLEALHLEDYPMAIEVLGALNQAYPSDTEVAAWLGIASYLSGDDSASTWSLLVQGTANMHHMISASAAWYLANSYLRSGEIVLAVALLETLDPEEINARRERDAAALLERIREIQGEQEDSAR